MTINALFHGILADWIGTKSARFDLAPGATYADLLAEIGRRFSRNMPEQLWDKEAQHFKARVLTVGSGGKLASPERPLKEEEEIKFYLMLAGG